MKTGPKIALGLVLVVLILAGSVPILAGLANQQGAAKDESSTAASDGAASSRQPAAVQQPRPQPAQQPQPVYQPPQPQQWTRETLEGTAWSVRTPQGNITVSLNPGGQAIANTPYGPVQGNWSVSGNQVRMSAMGQSVTCYIKGWELALPSGYHARRVQ